MTDYFGYFGLPRRPILSLDELKARYLQLAARSHPDATSGSTDDFTVLQEGMHILEDPAERLRHLMQLENPGHVTAPVGPGDGNLFLEIAGTLQKTRVLADKRDAAQSALAKALLLGEVKTLLSTLRGVQAKLKEGEAKAVARLQELDARWPNVAPDELNALAVELTYLGKWRKQLAEGEFRLAEG